ncbi:MAG: TMEM165/GDT1 family protein [Anaerolineae bacterium]|nr:TMEM165/GDT1 family protein [Anaerolineae bacterium]
MGLLILREAINKRVDNESACALDPGADCTPTSGWNWKAFTSTCGLLFVAELGDKTQLAVLSMASKSAAPWAVFAGGALALISVTALGVVGGQGLCKLVPERILLIVSAAAFILMGILMGAGIL